MKFFELLCLGQIACISATLMITIVVMKITGWNTLLTFIVAHFFQLAGYSFVGTLIETKVIFFTWVVRGFSLDDSHFCVKRTLFVNCIAASLNICLSHFQNERLETSIYSIPWYHLSIPDQKLFLLFLLNSQRPKKFYLLGAQSINVASGLAVCIQWWDVFFERCEWW